MRTRRKKLLFPLLCLMVGLLTFGVSYTLIGQAPGDDESTTPGPPGNVDDAEPPEEPEAPGEENLGDSIGPVAIVNELADIINAPPSEGLKVLSGYLEDGGDSNLTDEDGLTGLHWAVGNSEISPIVHGQVDLLIEAGADPNRVDKDGKTPLHYAAEFGGSDAVVNALIAGGGNAELGDNHGNTALAVALYWGNTGVVAALEKANVTKPANYDFLKTWGLAGKWLGEAIANAKSAKEQKEAVRTWADNLHKEGILTEEQSDQVYEEVSGRATDSTKEECKDCEKDENRGE